MADLQAGDVPIVDLTSLLANLRVVDHMQRMDLTSLRRQASMLRIAADRLDRIADDFAVVREVNEDLLRALGATGGVPSPHERADPPRP